MVQALVRYRPEVERTDPHFDESLRKVLEISKGYIAGSVKAEGVNRAVRDAHAKGFGLVRGELEILAGLPAEYAQGIYSTPGRHEALIRFSSGNPHLGPDKDLGPGVGIGLKLFGIAGPTLLEDEPDSGTFDYNLINNPTFFANTVEQYMLVDQLFLEYTKPPAGETPAAVQRARFHQFLHVYLTGNGTLPPEKWLWEELFVYLSMRNLPDINLLLQTYWSMGAVRHGDYIAKVRVKPVQAHADKVVRRAMDRASAAEVLRPALVAELRERSYAFDLQIQLCADLDRMPVEDLTVEWPTELSPFMNVGRLHLPRQDIGGDENLMRMDPLSFTPWRCTEAHRPLGNLQRARKEVYRQSSILRHQLNHQQRREPKNLAEVFGG